MTSDVSSALNRLVDRCGQLYSLPTVAVQVLKLTESPAVDVRQIKECIENDPALTSKILRVVNSSLFGLSREVTDLNQALALLGINPLKLLVLGFSLPTELFIGLNGDVLRRYWQRTLNKAVAAREIAQTILGMSGDEAFIAGLLQDIGMLVLLQEVGPSYSRFLDEVFSKSADVYESEHNAFGFNHAELSARLLTRWNLPPSLAATIESATSRQRIEALPPIDRPVPQVLMVSDVLASVLAENRTDLLAELLDLGREYFALNHHQLSSLVRELSGKVDHLAEVLQLDLEHGQNYEAVLLSAHERLSAVASEVAQCAVRQTAVRGHVDADEDLLADVQRLTRHATHVANASSERRVRHIDADRSATPVLGTAGTKSALEATQGASGRKLTRGASSGVQRPSVARQAESEFDPGLVGRVTAAVATCRQARRSLSLAIVEIDHYADLVMVAGQAAAESLVERVGAECRRIDQERAVVVQYRDLQFAIILADCDRRQAVDVANDLLIRLRRSQPPALDHRSAAAMTVSIGVASVALPPKNFPADELIRGAERCLNAARLSGGNGVKSIEIY